MGIQAYAYSMNKIVSLFLILCIGCSHAPKQEFDRRIQSLQCEEALQAVPELREAEQVKTNAEWAAKSTVAYSYVGLNYTAQVLWNVSVGALAVVVICAPVIMVVASSVSGKGNGGGYAQCLPIPISDKIWVTGLGKQALHETRDLRCPNVEPLALSLEKVAGCFENRNTPEDRVRAVTTLSNIEDSRHFFSCISPETQKRIVEKHLELQKVTTQN